MKDQFDTEATAVKREWVRPELSRMEAGSAESQSGSVSDGGGGLQTS